MTEFWEESFADKQEMWGLEAAASAVLASKLFLEKSIKKVLIPGIGYGRNAQSFVDSGMQVTGIEISKTAIELSQKHYGTDMTIYHGSVTDMPFDDEKYDGIFCYGLIHLLDQNERAKLISDCYDQLAENGYMVFTAITKNAQTYGKGTYLSKDRFEMFGGVKMFFYDKETIKNEFEYSGLMDIVEIEENYPFYMIICKKGRD
uniref:class I SAM-dependent methyltransferase n=1 Tax=Pedobacter schmidteae TaxID=2201271 RepID=UPI000EB5614C|nr:class I SAM-dependent methyltransferase [Pedobacter schmidteae]